VNTSGGKGHFPATLLEWKDYRDISLSYGVEIWTDDYSVLSQYTHLTDGQTDRRTDRQNCDSNTMRCITCSCTVKIDSTVKWWKNWKH